MTARPVPLFSVITVVLNDDDGLAVTHASLRAQTFRDFEWIVIDGGSTDGTRDYLRRHADDLAGWRSGPDAGIYDAMNRGMAAARGDYLLFLNAGDRLAAPDVLARLAGTLAAGQCPDLVYGDSLEAGPDGRLYRKPARTHRNAWYGMFAQHPSMLFRRAALDGLAYDTRYAVAADYALALGVIARHGPILQVGWPVSACAPPGWSALHATDGRREQWLIRRRILGWPHLACLAVYLVQCFAWAVRRHRPTLFTRIRCRS